MPVLADASGPHTDCGGGDADGPTSGRALDAEGSSDTKYRESVESQSRLTSLGYKYDLSSRSLSLSTRQSFSVSQRILHILRFYFPLHVCFNMPSTTFSPDSLPDLTGRVYLVTGGNAGM